jgi:hypothetical protein
MLLLLQTAVHLLLHASCCEASALPCLLILLLLGCRREVLCPVRQQRHQQQQQQQSQGEGMLAAVQGQVEAGAGCRPAAEGAL